MFKKRREYKEMKKKEMELAETEEEFRQKQLDRWCEEYPCDFRYDKEWCNIRNSHTFLRGCEFESCQIMINMKDIEELKKKVG